VITVEVRNFQSIEHVTLKVEGFTVLVGKSDLGKSAIVRAVKAALTGSVGNAFVRHSESCLRRVKKSKTCECYSSVHIKKEGFDLLWEKGDKRNRYVYNGKEYGVPSRGTPDFLERPLLAHDFGMVKVGEQRKLLQVSDQFDNIFLLDQTGGTVADVFSDVARLDRVNVAIRYVEKDRKDTASTRKVRESDLITISRNLTTYEGLDSVLSKAHQVGEQLEKVLRSTKQVEKMTVFITNLKSVSESAGVLEGLVGYPIPEIGSTMAKHQESNTLAGFVLSLGDRAGAVKRLSGVESVPDLDMSAAQGLAKKYLRLTEWSNRLRDFQESLGRFRGLSEVAVGDHSKLGEMSGRVVKLCELSNRFEATSKSIQSQVITEVPELDGDRLSAINKVLLDKVYYLYDLSQTVESINNTIARIEGNLEGIGQEESKVMRDREEFERSYPYCPTCAQPIGVEHEHKRVA